MVPTATMLRSFFEPALGWRQLTYEMRIGTSDPNSRAQVAFAAGTGGQITGTVKGGAADTYPLAGMGIYFTPVDDLSAALDPAKSWSIEIALVMDTQAGTSTDTAVEIGMLNEATTSVTVDGQYGGIHATAAGRNVRSSGIVNGANTGLADDGATAGTLTGVVVLVQRVGTRRTAMNHVQGVDNTGQQIDNDSSNGNTTGGGSTYLASGTPTLFAAVHRTAATAGTVAVAFRLYYRVLGQTGLLT